MADRWPVLLRRFLTGRSRRSVSVTPPAAPARPPASPLSPLALRLLRFVLGTFFRLFRSSGAWKEAVSIATADARVRRALGDPVTPGAWVGGRIHVSGDSGEAAFVVPLHGSCGDASLSVQARKSRGVWNFQILEARVRGGPVIDLLDGPAGSLPPVPRRGLPGPSGG